MNRSVTQVGKRAVVTALLAVAVLCTSLPANAATPYEAQLAGRVYAVLTTLIIGEFGGRTRANTDGTLNKRICQPIDYDDLREAAKDNATLIAFHRQCDLVETKVDITHVHNIAYPPSGYCETLKNAFETVLIVHVYPVPNTSRDPLILEYKGLRLEIGAPDREMIRRAQLHATCQDDGALRVSALRKRS